MRLYHVAVAHDQRQLWAAAAVFHVRRGSSMSLVQTPMPRGPRSAAASLRVVAAAQVRLPVRFLHETRSHSGRSDNMTMEPLSYHWHNATKCTLSVPPFRPEKVQKRVRARVKGMRPTHGLGGDPSTYKIQVELDSAGPKPIF